MKTGFTNAFPNKPLNKYYMYHGILMPCNIQPDPESFANYDISSEPLTWIIAGGNLKVISPYMYLTYKTENFLPSKWPDNCSIPFPDGKQRYYFIDLYIQKLSSTENVEIDLNYGNECRFFNYTMTNQYEHIAMWFILYAGQDWIFRYPFTKVASSSRLYRTSNGNLNTNWPVPLDWKYA